MKRVPTMETESDSMTESEWDESANPSAMIRWLAAQGYAVALWQFTIACCHRIWNELPGDAFQRVVEHADLAGTHGIDDVLDEAHKAIRKLERRLLQPEASAQQQLSRQIGFGRMVFAFQYHDGVDAAHAISRDLVEWADDAGAEQRMQAELLRQIVPDPSLRITEDEDEVGDGAASG